MATIKAYTDLSQSKTLSKILPIESADMWYSIVDNESFVCFERHYEYEQIPCWSLAVLLGIASTYCSRLEITLRADKKYNVFAVKNNFVFRSFDDHPDGFDNLIDACAVMIQILHKLKML